MMDVLFVLAALAAQPLAPEAWSRADENIVRLSPREFKELPDAVHDALAARQCTIPQTFASQQPHNVIRGSFETPGRIDWAVLCSRQRRSSILIFRGGSSDDVLALAERADRDFLQTAGPGEIGFSRQITVATPAVIQQQHERHGGPVPPPLLHDGIDDAFIEKASIVWYWHEGAWVSLTGTD